MTLKEANIPFALGGSYACWARGGPEPVHDVDFMLREEDVPRAVEVLAASGLRPVDPPEDWLTKVFDGEVLVDLIHHPVGRAVTGAMLERSSEMSVDSVRMPVLDATDWFEMTLLALEERYCDLARVLPMIRAMREQVDWEQVRRSTAASPFAEAALLVATRLNLIPPTPTGITAGPTDIAAGPTGTATGSTGTAGRSSGAAGGPGHTAAGPIGGRRNPVGPGRTPVVTAGADVTEADEYLAGDLHELLAEDPRVAELGLEVSVREGVILVVGEVATAARRRAVTEVLREAAAGRPVHNEVAVTDQATATGGTTVGRGIGTGTGVGTEAAEIIS
ncbi:BON domain-containing protein [Frankia sp. R82]|uniref:BON domain-containing protein n=1 Tax=Frankia sp. R82 TaxID=2950553 RepID=UPI0027E330B4|nr:BON domain-containing protein [Frankia sp. R82]